MTTKKEKKQNNQFVLRGKVVGRSCSNCKFFESFRDAYYDNMEPDDEGFCRNGESPRFGNEEIGRASCRERV